MKTVHVAAGVICRGDEVLVERRGYGSHAGEWEFPGGKVEGGETPEDACVRELAEELRVRVGNLRSCYTVEHDYPDFHLSMECFFCDIEPDGEGRVPEPQMSDRQRDLRWVARRDLLDLTWMPADVEFVGLLARAGEDGPDSAASADEAAGAPGVKVAERRPSSSTSKSKKLIDQLDTQGLSAGEAELVRRREATKRSMKGNVRANTKPELLVRQRLRAAGLTGYRLQWKKAPGRPDIAFPGRRVAIFVNGCFWHRCPHCSPSMPRKNVAFWEAKFARNQERDRRALAELAELGWRAIVIWECELKRDAIDATMERVVEAVRAATPARATLRKR